MNMYCYLCEKELVRKIEPDYIAFICNEYITLNTGQAIKHMSLYFYNRDHCDIYFVPKFSNNDKYYIDYILHKREYQLTSLMNHQLSATIKFTFDGTIESISMDEISNTIQEILLFK